MAPSKQSALTTNQTEAALIATALSRGGNLGKSAAETLDSQTCEPVPSTPPKRHKYGAQRTEVDGHVFASKKEATRYSELKLRKDAGEITNLTLQPKFSLHGIKGEKVATYIADFSYFEGDMDRYVVEDVKSKATMTPVYRLKKKLFEAEYGIKIVEI